MIFGFIGVVAAWASAAVGAVTGTVAWQASGISKRRRRARRAIRPLRKESDRFDKAIRPWARGAEAAADHWVAEERGRRIADMPLETLRQAGASRVRWSALEDAGYKTLADVRGLSAEQLEAIHGIGDASAERVAEAAHEVERRILSEPPPIPNAGLDTPEAQSLAIGSLELLDAQDIAGDAPRQLRERTRSLEERYKGVRRTSRFGHWFGGLFLRERRRREEEEAERLVVDAERARDGGLLEGAREGRRRLEKAKRERPKRREGEVPRPDPEKIQELTTRFRDRFAECCAIIEELYTELGLRARAVVSRGQGGVTEEVAQRVEEFPLDASGVRATLRRYQEFGAKYLLAQERTILGDEMGLGKTMQSLAVMTHLRDTEDLRRFFVVAPAGILVNWIREVRRFTSMPAWLLHGSELEQNLESWVRDGGVAVTSYATLRTLDFGEPLARCGGTVDLLIADEAHYAKNPEAGRTQAVARLAERSRYVAFLSGTPMENRPDEFLNLIEVIRPGEGEALRARELHVNAAAGSVRQFHEAVARVYLRRNQQDVLTELPDRIEMEEWVDLTASDLAAYREAVRSGNFMAMRQRATLGDVEEGVSSAKLEHLEELLEDHRESGRRVIIFSYFLDVLKAVAERFDTIGTVHGGVSPEDRQALVDDLGKTDGHGILLLQIQAGGQGLNIQAASAVVLMEPQTKPSIEVQAIARAHRMGQTERVLVHRILARGTCDETMLELLGEKERLFDAFARQSSVKEASAQATETSLARAVVEAEKARLEEGSGGDAPAAEDPASEGPGGEAPDEAASEPERDS